MKPWMMALIGKQRVLKSMTFTANATWIAPSTTSALVSAAGKGADGTPDSWSMTTIQVMTNSRSGFNQTGGATVTKADAVNDGLSEAGKFQIGGTGERSVTYTRITYTVGPDNLTARTTPFSLTRTVRGNAEILFGDTTGDITHTPSSLTFVSVSVEAETSGTTGASTTGFGKTFPGGVEGLATTTTFNNVAVTPNASYSVVVPSGGTLTITYYE